MKTMTVKAYSAIVLDNGAEYAVQIGVLDNDTPELAYWDSWIDPEMYFNTSQAEIDAMKPGDIIFDDVVLVSIDPEPAIFEAEYNNEYYEALP